MSPAVSWFATLFGIWLVWGGGIVWGETDSAWAVVPAIIGICLIWMGYGAARGEDQ